MRIPTYMADVVRTAELTPRMIRVTVGGEGLRGFGGGRHGDERIKLFFPRPGEREPPLPLADREGIVFAPDTPPPSMRTFSVRRFDPERLELEIDMVVHDGGVASTWVRSARPGSRVGIAGPRGGYLPAADADALLLAGDESALPAIATILERVPAHLPTTALIEVGDANDVQGLPNAGRLDLRWLPRGTLSPAEGPLAAAVRSWPWPATAVHVWAAGEALAMKSIRRYLRDERRLDRAAFQVSGYWRHRLDEDEALAAHHRAVQEAEAAGASPVEIEDAGVY